VCFSYSIKFYSYDYGPGSLGTIVLIHLSKQKLKVMKYKLSVLNERLEYLTKQLRDNIEVIEVDGDFTKIEVHIVNSSVLLDIFHAGVMSGLDVGLASARK
jgi:hypothetical protein